MSETIKIDIEVEARQLREILYGPIPDEKWCDPMRANWIRDIRWLRDHAAKSEQGK